MRTVNNVNDLIYTFNYMILERINCFHYYTHIYYINTYLIMYISKGEKSP